MTGARNQPRIAERQIVNVRMDVRMYRILRYLSWRDNKSMSKLIGDAIEGMYGSTPIPDIN